MRKLPLTIALLLLPLTAWPECVQISDAKLQPGDAGERPLSAVTPLKWQATFRNTCDQYVDVSLAVDLIDKRGETVYTLNAAESFDYQEEMQIEKEAYVPSRIAEQAVDVEMNKEEQIRRQR